MVRISQINLGKVDYTKTGETTRVPKTTVQTFQPSGKTDYTTVVREYKYADQIKDLQTKYNDIEPEQYLEEAANNGFRQLLVTDADYTEFGEKWDKLAS